MMFKAVNSRRRRFKISLHFNVLITFNTEETESVNQPTLVMVNPLQPLFLSPLRLTGVHFVLNSLQDLRFGSFATMPLNQTLVY